jgi:hypothetical protein
MEVLDEFHYSLNDWPDYLDQYVVVSDWYDVDGRGFIDHHDKLW